MKLCSRQGCHAQRRHCGRRVHGNLLCVAWLGGEEHWAASSGQSVADVQLTTGRPSKHLAHSDSTVSVSETVMNAIPLVIIQSRPSRTHSRDCSLVAEELQATESHRSQKRSALTCGDTGQDGHRLRSEAQHCSAHVAQWALGALAPLISHGLTRWLQRPCLPRLRACVSDPGSSIPVREPEAVAAGGAGPCWPLASRCPAARGRWRRRRSARTRRLCPADRSACGR
jgi:hypothetical protein